MALFDGRFSSKVIFITCVAKHYWVLRMLFQLAVLR